MPESFYAVALLACPVGMGLMMWFMMRGGTAASATIEPPRAADDLELAKLRAEVDELRARGETIPAIWATSAPRRSRGD